MDVCLIVEAESDGGGEKLSLYSITFSIISHMPGTVLDTEDPDDFCNASYQESEHRGQTRVLGPLVETTGLCDIWV